MNGCKYAYLCTLKPIAATLLALTLTCTVRATGGLYFCQEKEARTACEAVGQKQIALTFDDGPHPSYTREILDILDEYGIRATFFVIGVNAETWPELVEAELTAGHEIGNHTYRHANLRTESYDTVRGEILGMENVLWQQMEVRPHLFRPPGGLYGDEVCRAAADLDYTVILWTVDTRDWAHTAAEEIVENVLTNTESGDIILFHDYVTAPSPTPTALRQIIPALLDRGYSFVTVSELLSDTGK